MEQNQKQDINIFSEELDLKIIKLVLKDENYYLHHMPIKQIYKEQDTGSFQIRIDFYLTTIISQSQLEQAFIKTFQRLSYIKYITFGVILLLSVFILFMAYRNASSNSKNLFQIPLENCKQVLEQIDNEDKEEQLDYDKYQKYFSCYEIQTLIQSIISLVNDIRIFNQEYKDDAQTLIKLSKAKLRYIHNGNLEGVGICCNNIGNIHLKIGRYSEAVSEYQESILMAKIEDKALQKQLNKIIEEEMPSYKQTYLDLKVRKQKAQEKTSYRESYSNKFASDISNNYSDDNQKLLIENKDTSQKLTDSKYYKLQANSNQRLMTIKKEQEELNKKLSGYNEDYGILFNKRNQVKQNMINRKYQLAGALLMYGISEKQVNFLPQCVNLLKQCIKLSDIVELSQTKNQRSQTVRKICIYTKLAICNIKLQNIKEAQINIKKAKNEFDMINMQKENKQQELDLEVKRKLNNFDHFDSIQNDVLNQNILYIEGIISLSNLKLKEAVEKLLESIQQPLNYDTNTRIETLKVMKNLYNIFMDNQQKKLQAADEINPFLDKFNLQSVDLIFLIEYSGKIKNEQLHTAQSIAKQVFDNLQNEDNLGLLIFNDCVHECFSLQNVKKYRDYLERKVRTIQKEPGGKSELQQSLIQATNYFYQGNQIREEYEEQLIDQGKKLRFLFLLTEGEQLKDDFKYEVEEIFSKKKIHLLTYNISQQNQNIIKLKNLTSQVSKYSKFFSEENELAIFFKQLREQQRQTQLVYEYLP